MKRSKSIFLLLLAIMMALNIWLMKSYNIFKNNPTIRPDLTIKSKKFIYFDLGSNNGDSILSFFGLKPRFPELFGGNLTCEKFAPPDAQWWIYAFEANSKFNADLDETVNKLQNQTKHKIKVFKQTAAWTYDGMISFYIENVTGFGLGSSLDENHPDVIKSHSTKTKVACRDIASFLKTFNLSDFIVMKIDIEGAEYDLIMDFIKKDAIQWVNHFAIEFHKQIRKFDSPEKTLNDILKLYNATSSDWL